MKTSTRIYLPFKRLIGLLGSFIGILICAVLLWWWVLLINLFVTHGHPVFRSERVGKNGKPFNLIKFRSMSSSVDPNLTSAEREGLDCLTGFGRFLRKTAIDETLQLFNIFIGQMSFIGPRPLIDVRDDSNTIKLRKENGSIVLRPGLSGYAQINRNSIKTSEKKAEYDLYYLQHLSFFFDLKIFVISLFGGGRPKK